MLLITISFVGIVVAVGLKFASLFSPSGRGELMLKAVLESLIKQKEYSTLKSGSDVAEFPYENNFHLAHCGRFAFYPFFHFVGL